MRSFDLSRDGKQLAYTTNEKGISGLYLLDAATGKSRRAENLPVGVMFARGCLLD
ncbi:MAG: hypothetical protein KJO09_09365 [Gammaproteobacteria bacterium]|nr:hypothetical protein [Gammaproteobacteria bacterium]